MEIIAIIGTCLNVANKAYTSFGEARSLVQSYQNAPLHVQWLQTDVQTAKACLSQLNEQIVQ
jgi:hypothetical protein